MLERTSENTPRFYFIMDKFKIGDKAEIIDKNGPYYGCKAIIRDTSRFNDNCYYFDILKTHNKTIIKTILIYEFRLKSLKEIKDEPFTISIRKHKRINLKFTI